jgi:hypothetical protein
MRVEPDKLQDVVELAVDEDEVRPHVAIAEACPRAGQVVIGVSCRERCIVPESGDDFRQESADKLAIRTRFDPS